MKVSNIKNMDAALKEYYASKSLSKNQLDELLSIQFEYEASNYLNLNDTFHNSYNDKANWLHRFIPNTRTYKTAFFATAFLFLASLVTLFSLLDHEPISQRIMNEIVYNHNQDMPIEIASSSLTDISKYLNKLSFSIVLPNALSEPNWQLLGGRYCSINGKLAAQLKVKNLKDNSVSTFFQAAINKDLGKNKKQVMNDTIDGVGVSIWHEHGLLLGLAKEKNAFIK